ncbi:tRNA (adenosine(37)-N6)-dimethylallyltransferase MiaA [bacterium SCSIO 12643]|nr:tRNA (adenosine(37)-N6)-dimethylallyltransferase MiaA [bacterium SCSIO 12643]
MKQLIVITGATACGKTSVSVEIAKKLGTEVISCDSRQFYKEMSIGTAKPTKEEMDGVKHHFVDSHSIQEEVNAGKFENLVLPLLSELFEKYDSVILTGGSGLFIDAVVNGFDQMPSVDPETRKELNTTFEQQGIAPLFEQLQKLDPEYAQIVDAQNPKRIIRALEVCLSTHKTYTELRTGKKALRPFRTIKFVLDHPRQKLYARINTRVDLMLDMGLEEECRNLIPFKHLNALQTVGYKEFFDYFEHKTDRDTTIELIKRNSRRYAKRQLTWFRRDPAYHWIEAHDVSGIMELIESDQKS